MGCVVDGADAAGWLPRPPPGPWPAHQPLVSAALLIFGMACRTLGRAQGRSLLPEALPRRGLHSSPGRSRSSGQYEINNFIAQIGFWLGPLPRCSQFLRKRGSPNSNTYALRTLEKSPYVPRQLPASGKYAREENPFLRPALHRSDRLEGKSRSEYTGALNHKYVYDDVMALEQEKSQ